MVEILDLCVIPFNWSYAKAVVKGRKNIAQKDYEISISNIPNLEYC
jgi:hypothetical protein